MDSEDKHSLMVIRMKGFIKKINPMEKESIVGQMDLFTMDSFVKD